MTRDRVTQRPWKQKTMGSTVSRVIRRHARRIGDTHHLAYCVPTETEVRQGFASLGRPGKVIYDTREKAANIARELRRLDGRRQVPYPCPRGEDEHWHLQSWHHALGQ